jgi:hypothetical protein
MRSSCPRGLGWRLSRSQRERTRREDRHLNFYGLRDNLRQASGDKLSSDALDALVEWYVAFATNRAPADSIILAYRHEMLSGDS